MDFMKSLKVALIFSTMFFCFSHPSFSITQTPAKDITFNNSSIPDGQACKGTTNVQSCLAAANQAIADAGGGTPGGANTSIQFNDSGEFNGFGTYDGTIFDIGSGKVIKGQYSNRAGSAYINPDGSAVFGGGGLTITNAGVISIGTFQGTAIADSYIASAATWNAKQNALTIGNISASTGINVSGGTGAIIGSGVTVTNTAPDQTVSFTGGTNVTIGGTYPAFVITDNSIGVSALNAALAAFTGTSNIVTVGTIGAGTWQGTAIADGFIASAATWNAKQPAGNYITALTGDGTASGPGSSALTLATVNVNTGPFGSSTSIPSFTVNGKGLITAASGNAVIAPAGTLTGTTINSAVTASSLTSFGNSPTFVTPILGTPTSGVLTNLTGLPLTSGVTGILPLANGGTAANLSDPGADVLMGWDDTDNATKYITIGSNLSYDHATHTLNATGGSSGFTTIGDVVSGTAAFDGSAGTKLTGTTAGGFTLTTPDEATGNTAITSIKTGDAASGNSGSIAIATGTASGTRGDFTLDSHNAYIDANSFALYGSSGSPYLQVSGTGIDVKDSSGTPFFQASNTGIQGKDGLGTPFFQASNIELDAKDASGTPFFQASNAAIYGKSGGGNPFFQAGNNNLTIYNVTDSLTFHVAGGTTAYTWPAANGTAGYVLSDSDGSGTLAWIPAGGGSGSITNIGDCDGPTCFDGTEGTLLTGENGSTFNLQGGTLAGNGNNAFLRGGDGDFGGTAAIKGGAGGGYASIEGNEGSAANTTGGLVYIKSGDGYSGGGSSDSGNILILTGTPGGAGTNGYVSIQGIKYPSADGSNLDVMTTNGSGQISFVNSTGTGNVARAVSPVFTTPNIGSATGSVSGNAGTATALQNARTIGGTSFNGTANITVATATGGFTVSGGDLALGANNITMSGSIGSTGTRLTKGWFTDLQVTNAIAGSVTGNAATVTTNANLTGDVTSSGNATTIGANKVTLGMQATLVANSAIANITGSTATPTAVSMVSTATASTIATRDANANLSAVNHIEGYTTTATAAGTTVLTVGSTYQQYFTGATTQTVTLPVASTLVLGQQFLIVNNSTGLVTVNSSGANNVIILAGSTSAVVTCILTSGTTAASWSAAYSAANAATGKKLTVSNTLTLAGTDATTMTFPSTSATIARTDAANTFTGTQTFTAPVLGTPASVNLSNATALPVGSITGFGSGVATWLATPSSANLISAVTDEVGTGSLMFNTSPKVITSLLDTNSNTLLGITATASSVNQVTLANSATTFNPTISATGSDTNIGVNLTAKGTGSFVFTSTSTSPSSFSTGMIGNNPTAETIVAAATITADSCGGIKRITAAGAVTTNTTNTFTAPAAANSSCIMYVVNTGANNITLDNNANFKSFGGLDVVMTPDDAVIVGSTGGSGVWYQLSLLVGN